MTQLWIPVAWFCGLLVSQATWWLSVLSSFSSSSPIHWPGEGADSLLCVESRLFFLFVTSSGPILWPSGFCFLSFPLWQFLFVSACLLLLFSCPASLPFLKGSLKLSSQIRRKVVATSSYFRCCSSSVKGIMRSLHTWPFPSESRKGLWVCSFPIIPLPASTLRGVGWRSCYWPV